MGRKSKKEGIVIIFKSKNCEKNFNKCKVMIIHLCDKTVNSVSQSCRNVWDLMDCSKPALPLPHYHPEIAKVYVHYISDAI